MLETRAFTPQAPLPTRIVSPGLFLGVGLVTALTAILILVTGAAEGLDDFLLVAMLLLAAVSLITILIGAVGFGVSIGMAHHESTHRSR